MKNQLQNLIYLGFFIQYIFCQTPSLTHQEINDLKINQLQVIGSHNSYRLAMDDNVFKWLSRIDSSLAAELDYSHLPLDQQFSQAGIRQIELDVYFDPDGGLFNHRLGNIVTEDPITPNFPELIEPGLKVLHFPDIDFQTNYLTFKDALLEVKKWSQNNPNHVPIFILIEAKDEGVFDKHSLLSILGFIRPLEFSLDALNTIDDEIREVFGADLNNVITPDNIRGNNQSLEEVVLNDGWPSLGESRGKVMFGLDNQGRVMNDYIEGHPSLKGRIMFVEASPGTPEAAFLGMNTPSPDITKRVFQGYLVRTRADSDTKSARNGNTSRRDKALNSGAHFISTDYYSPDPRHEFQKAWTNYSVRLPGNIIARVNPVTGPTHFINLEIE